MSYDEVRYIMSAWFSINHGLDYDDNMKRFRQHLQRPSYKESLRNEIVASLSDPEFSWLALLDKEGIAWNESIGSETDARAWVSENLLTEFFDSGTE
jgi:hypothetical protein